MFPTSFRPIAGLLLLLIPGSFVVAQKAETVTKPFPAKGDDGLDLEGVVDLPAAADADQVQRVIVMVHGSGAHSRDVDLTSVTRGGEENLVFRTLGQTLATEDFAVIRYHKRNYQVAQLLKEEPESESTGEYRRRVQENPLGWFVKDVLSVANQARQQFPNARIYLLGHSEGTYVALQAANQADFIAGVALIGFAEYSTSTLAFVQTVYRPLYDFSELDANSDGQLSADELNADTDMSRALKRAVTVLDLDKNGEISRTEFQAANLANLLVRDIFAPFRKQEAKYPRVAEILKTAPFKVAFFQGMLDNQTPAYHAMAMELLLKQLGKSENRAFHYFPGLGHALDQRDSYQDLQFSLMDPDALSKVKSELDQFFN